MLRLLCLSATLATLTLSGAQAAEVGVSISVAQPGVYGRIDIGRFPAPVLVQAQPMLVRPVVAAAPPVYLWVPPGHRRDWRHHCRQYQACATPVYFVQDGWYRQQVLQRPEPAPRGRHRGDDHGERHGGRGHGHGHGHHD